MQLLQSWDSPRIHWTPCPMWPTHTHRKHTTWCGHSAVLCEDRKQRPHLESFGECGRLAPISLVASCCSLLELLLVSSFVGSRSSEEKELATCANVIAWLGKVEVVTPTFHTHLPYCLYRRHARNCHRNCPKDPAGNSSLVVLLELNISLPNYYGSDK